MNAPAPPRIARSVCPHDCPSTCALDVEFVDDNTIGRVRGAKDDPYTDGVICEKVARYAERIHHPERLLYPLKRIGKKDEGKWQRISWTEALDEIAARFLKAEQEHGAESVWPYYYAGTMGHVQRDGIHRLRHARGYSRQYDTICTRLSWAGYIAGTGRLTGVNPEQMAEADCVVIWGTNAVHTQVNVMTHAMKARKNRNAKIVVIDIYNNATVQQADMGLILKPGTDGALALGAMHVLLRERLADEDYLAEFTDFDDVQPRAGMSFRQHLADKTPEWAAAITGLKVDEIVAFARLIGRTKHTFFRLGYGFSRQRNGATNMHAALCIPAMTGAWKYRGGGAFHSNSGIWGLDKSAITGKNLAKIQTRNLDMSRIGAVLTGDNDALKGGPPVMAMLVQNTNPASVASDQTQTLQGLAREDLFLVVHEQFMTETAELADIVLPATMFLEHDDYYTRGGHTRILFGPKLKNAPSEARPNSFVIDEIAKRLGMADEVHFGRNDKAMVMETLKRSGVDVPEDAFTRGYIERALPEAQSRFAEGFAWPDKKFRFAPDWTEVAKIEDAEFVCEPDDMPVFADWVDNNEPVTAETPFRLATSPARAFLNSSFNETAGSRKREGAPSLFIHPKDARAKGLNDGDEVVIGNARGEVALTIRLFDGVQRGVVIAESVHPNKAHKNGKGINTLIDATPAPPFGGAVFHDCAVWVRPSA